MYTTNVLCCVSKWLSLKFLYDIHRFETRIPSIPLPFFLVANGLSLLIKDARRRGVLKGVKVSNFVNITHLLFFDDVLLFGDGTSQELRSLRTILDLYCKAMGMELNLRKSCMLLNCIPMDVSNQL
jgi:hypothetical protein